MRRVVSSIIFCVSIYVVSLLALVAVTPIIGTTTTALSTTFAPYQHRALPVVQATPSTFGPIVVSVSRSGRVISFNPVVHKPLVVHKPSAPSIPSRVNGLALLFLPLPIDVLATVCFLRRVTLA
jgi:hypothetical protein